jgi:hypothetical protein
MSTWVHGLPSSQGAPSGSGRLTHTPVEGSHCATWHGSGGGHSPQTEEPPEPLVELVALPPEPPEPLVELVALPPEPPEPLVELVALPPEPPEPLVDVVALEVVPAPPVERVLLVERSEVVLGPRMSERPQPRASAVNVGMTSPRLMLLRSRREPLASTARL